jgi:pimeloyl-ACP methyl ester carboxylesterase
MPFVRVNGTALHYTRVGPDSSADGTAEPMLWLPGFAISANAWQPVEHHYSGAFDCIAFDNRATGRSGPSRRVISIPQLAGDAVGVLDALGIASAHVYGISYGGMVAQEMAIRFPDRVRGLILGGTTPGGPRAHLPDVAGLVDLGRTMTRSSGKYGLAGALFSERFRQEQPDRARELAQNLLKHRAPRSGVVAHLLASVYHDTYSRLRLIRSPTLVVHGGDDRMTPLRNAHLLVDRIPDAELAVIPGTGHAYLLEKPEESAEVVLEFLRRRAPEAGQPRRSRTEPLSRAWGLPVGALRTAQSLAAATWRTDSSTRTRVT